MGPEIKWVVESDEEEVTCPTCPICGVEMEYREFVSMGPGYDEWETGEDQFRCPICRLTVPSIDLYSLEECYA